MSDDRQPVLSLIDVQGFPNSHGDSFAATVAPLGATLGLRNLGAMLTVVEPGKRAFPFHAHHANDELFLILEGGGTYRYGDTEYPVRAGDLCAAPAGAAAHQLINTGEVDLKYISISTMNDPDIVEYPDSGKFAALSIGEGNDFANARLKYIGRAGDSLEYWEGEG